MSLKIKLFGDLKKKVPDKTNNVGIPNIITIESKGIERVFDIINNLSIKESEVSHIFVNNRYAGFKKKVKNGDTIALFPTKMSLLYKWYYHREEDD